MAESPPPSSPSPAAPPRRPRAIAIVAAAGSAIGIFGVVHSATELAGERDPDAPLFRPGLPRHDEAFERELRKSLARIERRWHKVVVPLASANIVLSGFLFVGAWMLIRRRPDGPAWFRQASIGNGAYRIAGTVVQSLIVRDIGRALRRIAAELPDPAGAGTPPAVEQGILRAAFVVGIAFAVGLALVEMGFYVFAIRYLRRPAVRALFGAPPAKPPAMN